MASGERITVTYKRFGKSKNEEGQLKLDLYSFVPPVDPNDPGPTFSSKNRLPFILFLHGGHFLTGSRRDLPAWLASLARDNGFPLICADYRLLPHAGPSDAFEDVQSLWTFLREEINWIIACSGNGAEVESGNEMLENDFAELQRRGGIDINRGIIVGVGSGGYLSSIGGALLSPPPIAMVMGYPLLEINKVMTDSPNYIIPANTPDTIRHLLHPESIGQSDSAKSSVPDMPMLLQKSPYAADMRARFGMDTQEIWKGKEERLKRQDLIQFLLKDDRLDALIRNVSPNLILPSELLLQSQKYRLNRPYPPTLIFHGQKDERISPESSQRFIDVIRTAEPVAAAMDALADNRMIRSNGIASSDQNSTTNNTIEVQEVALRCLLPIPNHTSRYVFLGLEGTNSGHAFDALLPREMRSPPFSRICPKTIGDRYKQSLIHVERFIQHWLLEGSAEQAAAQEAQRAAAAAAAENEEQKGDIDELNDKDLDKTAAGAHIKLPLRNSRFKL